MIESYRGKTRLADGRQIPSTAFDVQDFQRFAHNVDFAQLDRGVATTVKYQRRIASQQLRAIDAQRQLAATARRLVAVPQSPHVSQCLVFMMNYVGRVGLEPTRNTDDAAIVAEPPPCNHRACNPAWRALLPTPPRPICGRRTCYVAPCGLRNTLRQCTLPLVLPICSWGAL